MRTDRRYAAALRSLALVFSAALAAASGAAAQEVDDCLACHSDDTLTAERDGVEISALVDGERFAASRHSGLACVDCHQDLVDQGDGHGGAVQGAAQGAALRW